LDDLIISRHFNHLNNAMLLARQVVRGRGRVVGRIRQYHAASPLQMAAAVDALDMVDTFDRRHST
jgi:hypothetical protein